MAAPRKLRKRDILLFVLIIALALLLVFGVSALIEHFSDSKRTSRNDRSETDNIGLEPVMPDDEAPEDAIPESELEKQSYTSGSYNNNIKNIVLIGVDKDELKEEDIFRIAGQSDVIMILSMNLKTKEYWLVSINRDLAVPVENYSYIGETYGFVTEQIALAYAYGDGTRLSGKNVIKSLNCLFGDVIPYLGFIAAPPPLIATLADAVDGVPVEITDDFSGIDDTLIKGETVVLRGAHAERYVRARKAMADDPYNAARMTRQLTFCESFIKKAKTSMTAKQLVSLHEDVMSMTVSDMGKNDVAKWILQLYDFERKGFYRIDGVRREGELMHDAPFNDVVPEEVEKLLEELYFK